MSEPYPCVDINLFAYNAEAVIGPAIESVLAQTWPALRLTVIDNGSTDGTREVVARYVSAIPTLRLHRARANGGALLNCQRAFLIGDNDFVMPKTADDLMAPDYVEQIMQVMLAHPSCAMCHAGAVVFGPDYRPVFCYPPDHRLHAVGGDPVSRARHVMARYTSAPSFWGIYRRDKVDLLAPFRYRAGWDHSVLAELACYGEIRHVPDPLFWRRDAGKPVGEIARGCTEAAQRGLDVSHSLADLRWRTPLISTSHAHLEAFAVARLAERQRIALMADARSIFRNRWLPQMRQEAQAFAQALPALRAAATTAEAPRADWMRQQIDQAVGAILCILPEARAWLGGTDRAPSGQTSMAAMSAALT